MASSFVQWNCRGLYKNYSEFKILVKNKNPGIISLQETKQKENQNLKCPRAYKPYSKPFIGGEIASGGVALLVNKDLIQDEITLNTQLQAIAVRITLHGKPMSVISLYLHPASKPSLRDLNNLLTQVPPPCVILGDLNAHNPIWGGTSRDQRGALVEEFLRVNNLILFNDRRPTWECPNSGRSSSIDLTIGHPSLRALFEWDVLNNPHGSDHYPTSLTHLSRKNGCDPRPQHWVMSRANFDIFKNKCEQEITREILDTEDALGAFSQKLREIALVCVPKSSADPKNPPVPWYDEECKSAYQMKKTARNKLKRRRTLPNVELYKKEEKNCKDLFNSKRAESWRLYVSGLTERVSSKQVWDMVRKISGKNITAPIKPLKLEGGRSVETRQEICEEISKTFQFHSSTENLPPGFAAIKAQHERTPIQFDLNSNGEEFYNKEFSMKELDRALDACNDTQVGPDLIHYQFIKNLPHPSTHDDPSPTPSPKQLFLDAINKAWRMRTFPKEWKEAIVIPIPKPDKDHSNPTNLRPISLTCCPCKVKERMVNNRLNWFLETNGLQSRWQSGARANRSTTDQLVRLEAYIREAWARKEHVLSVFFDIEKAYDTAWKHGVLSDLHQMGLRGNILAFIDNYLSGRTFRVRLGACLSDSKEQEEGYPQGGVLSSTLFKIRIDKLANEIPENTMKSLFVDDLNINKSGRILPPIVRQTQLAINKIYTWCKNNGFKISFVKTKAVLFTLLRTNEEIVLTIGDRQSGIHQIAIVDCYRFLGVIVDNKLTYKKHIEDVKEKCTKITNLLQVVSHQKWGADRSTKLKLWRALRPKIEHGSILFSSASKTHLKKIEAVQTKALSICLNAFCTSPKLSLLAEANELPILYRFGYLAMNYALSVKANPGNPTNEALFKDYSEVVREQCIPPMGYKLNQAFTDATINPASVKHLINPTMPPAMLEGQNINLSLSDYPKDETLPDVFLNLFREIRDNEYHNSLQIYTDGSKKDLRVGAAYVIPSRDHTSPFRLPDGGSVYTAESFAIREAILFAKDLQEVRKTVIFSDSLSCLQALQGIQIRNPFVCEILNLLHYVNTRTEKEVHLCWIPGHVGITGNEAADKAAKEALDLPDDEIVRTGLPYSDFKPHIRKYWQETWQNTWEGAANSMYPVHPSLPYKFPNSILSRHEEWVYTRIHIGHTRLTHGHRLNLNEEPPLCEGCGEQITIHHLLIECADLDEVRREYYEDIVSLEQLFSEVHPRQVLNFLREIGVFYDI